MEGAFGKINWFKNIRDLGILVVLLKTEMECLLEAYDLFQRAKSRQGWNSEEWEIEARLQERIKEALNLGQECKIKYQELLILDCWMEALNSGDRLSKGMVWDQEQGLNEKLVNAIKRGPM